MMENDNEENVDDEEDDIIEEYASNPADLERICNHYRREENSDDEDDDNPAAIPFCLNIVGSSIWNIPDRSLQFCRALTEVRVQQGGRRRIIVRTIGEWAFYGCKHLRRINEFLKHGGVIRLEYLAFVDCGIEGELIIPSSVVFVGGGCFEDCTSITSVVFEASSTGTVVVIQEGAFLLCTELLLATLPPTLECIPEYCFGDCCALINVPIPPTVVELQERSFRGCTSLQSMDLPESVDAIGKETFLDCTALTTVTIRSLSNDIQIDNDVFNGCTALTTINVRPWIWGKLLSSMKIQNSNATLPIERRHNESKAQFLDKFLEGTFVPLHSIHLYSWYGPQLLESVQDRPNTIYRILRTFSNFFDDIPTKSYNANRTTSNGR